MRTPDRSRIVLILCALCGLATAIAVPLPAELAPDARQRMLEELQYLASDDLEGRGVDTEGINLAAARIRQGLADAGLDVNSVSGSAFQGFEMVIGSELREPNLLSFVGPDRTERVLQLDSDFRTQSFGTAGTFSAPIVFCGYGIEAPDLEYDSFAGVDLDGNVAVIMRRTPQQGEEQGLFNAGHHGTFMKHAALSSKLKNAIDRGAVAVLFVNDPYSGSAELEKLKEQQAKAEQSVVAAAEALVDEAAEQDAEPQTRQTLQAAVTHLRELQDLIANYDADPLMEFGYAGRSRGKAVPVMHVAQSTCDQLLSAALGKTLADMEAEIDAAGKPVSRELAGWQAVGQTSLKVVRREVKNVVGVLPGTGPRAEETVIVGAHYDHVGRGGEGLLAPGSHEVHNGADDNASGTVALLELARRLAARETPLPRRIVFIAFTGEERGLLGSAHYVKDPLVPLEQTIAMFNMDMVGRMVDDKLTVFGTGTAKRWDEWLDTEAEVRGLDITKKPEGLGPSDHSSFYAKRIPVLHFFTGTHNDYHRPTDDWEKVNIEGIGRVVDLLEELVVTTAETEAPPEYVAVKGKASLEQRSGARPYFGSIPDFGTEAEGYAIQGVSPDSPAERAGVRGGDVLIKLGEHLISGLDDFDLALRTFSAGEAVSLVVLRDGEEVTLRVTLATPRQ